MKFSLGFILSFTFAIVVFGESKICYSNDDCEEDECCTTRAFITLQRGRCRKLGREGSHCTPLEKLDEEEQKMYRYYCPCQEGLNCVSDKKIEISGHKVKYEPKCEFPDTTEEPQQ